MKHVYEPGLMSGGRTLFERVMNLFHESLSFIQRNFKGRELVLYTCEDKLGEINNQRQINLVLFGSHDTMEF